MRPPIFLLPMLALSAGTADLGKSIRETAFDPAACYRVRDLSFARQDIKIYLTDGYLLFAKPTSGRRLAAVFTTDVEGGDAEVILLPPNSTERRSLAKFIDSPNLNEHFTAGMMVFTDDTAAELLAEIESKAAKRGDEMGALLADKWNPVLKNFLASYEVRIAGDLTEDRGSTHGFFSVAISGRTLGNFDMVYDPEARDQILAGQLAYRDSRQYFDVWTTFQARNFRDGTARPAEYDFTIRKVTIDATLDPALNLKCVTRIAIEPRRVLRSVSFDLTRQMRVNSAKIAGAPAEVFQKESLRANLVRGRESEIFLLSPQTPLEPGQAYEVEIEHEGGVVTPAGNGVFYVASRGSWYPQHGTQFSDFDITFHHHIFHNNNDMTVVATGELVADKVDGDIRTMRRRTSAPVRMAAFNLGDYAKTAVSRGGLAVEVFANRKLETALTPRPIAIDTQIPAPQQRRRPLDSQIASMPATIPPPNPAARSERLASDVAECLEFFSSFLGPPPVKTVTVSPIPGTFGQGFPGMIYLSTLAYLEHSERPAAMRSEANQIFFSQLLVAHETAHQWWGNQVAALGYHDEWLMESLANYSGLMFFEKKRGAKALDSVLDQYRIHLLEKDASGQPAESAGPINLGQRLSSSQSPGAWRTITYEKGSWVIHMLRRRMGDKAFQAMLGEVVKRHAGSAGLSTDGFRKIAAAFLPKGAIDPQLENFFEHWVYSTGVPALKLTSQVKGRPPAVEVTGTVAQSGVPEDFSIEAPVVIQLPRGETVTHWVRTGDEPAPFQIRVKAAPVKVTLDPAGAVLTKK